tara:strand:+ start:3808 stop:3990 length:183 start_codon:yes stop_codon:yes gene_type:complete
MQFNNTYYQHNWQILLQQAQALAARLPDMGLNPEKLALLPLDDLLGVAAFLKRKTADREG